VYPKCWTQQKRVLELFAAQQSSRPLLPAISNLYCGQHSVVTNKPRHQMIFYPQRRQFKSNLDKNTFLGGFFSF